jgi:hypothetical protein
MAEGERIFVPTLGAEFPNGGTWVLRPDDGLYAMDALNAPAGVPLYGPLRGLIAVGQVGVGAPSTLPSTWAHRAAHSVDLSVLCVKRRTPDAYHFSLAWNTNRRSIERGTLVGRWSHVASALPHVHVNGTQIVVTQIVKPGHPER